MKWYGKAHTLDILEHGDDNRQKWEQEYVAIKDTFQFEISVHESWYEDADLYESHEAKIVLFLLLESLQTTMLLCIFQMVFPLNG